MNHCTDTTTHCCQCCAYCIQGDPALPDNLTEECATLWDQSARLVDIAQHCCAVIHYTGEPAKTTAAAKSATTTTTRIPEVEPSQATPGLTEGEKALAAAERDSSAAAGLKQQQPKEVPPTAPTAQHALAY
eukprot:15221-Heterococcus_DN1.PRE.1